jgi:transcriptional regulator of acetoin/glycerol metabolism
VLFQGVGNQPGIVYGTIETSYLSVVRDADDQREATLLSERGRGQQKQREPDPDTSGGTPARLSDKARDALVAHTWPGNIRELRNVLETAAILNEEGVIEPHHLSLQPTVPVAADTQNLQTTERRMIERVLQQTGWNKSRAARQLGLTRTQLYGRLRRHGLENP